MNKCETCNKTTLERMWRVPVHDFHRESELDNTLLDSKGDVIGAVDFAVVCGGCFSLIETIRETKDQHQARLWRITLRAHDVLRYPPRTKRMIETDPLDEENLG